MRAGDEATARRFARRAKAAGAVLAVGLVAAGCRRESATPALPPAEPSITAPAEPPPEPPTAGFTPPATRADLDRQVTWVDRPVRDALALAREQDAREPATCSVAEALARPNDSPEANAHILAALMRPPVAGAPWSVDRVSRHLPADVESVNPLRAETAAEFDLLELTGLQLFGFDRSRAAFANADTVATWRTSADGLVDEVVLRDDLTWSDGRPVTARDVAFSWRLVTDQRVPARAFREGARRLRAVHAYDDRTVAFFHAEPLATNAWDIDFPVLPRHVYESSWERDPSLVSSPEHVAREARPVTGGPYEVASRTPGREIVLRRRAGWAVVRGRSVRSPAPFAELRLVVHEDPATALEALEAGELDDAALAPEQWATATGTPSFTDRAFRLATPDLRSLQIVWNLDTPLFADRRVRRAMGYAFDHGRLLDGLCQGLATPATGPFEPLPPEASRRAAEPPRQDLAKAEALLDEAGWIDHDGDGVRDREVDGRRVPCGFTLVCDHDPFRVAVAALARDSLARVGVTCTVRALDPRQVHERFRSRRFEACLTAWGAGVDPDATASLWTASGPRNVSGYANPDVDRLAMEGRRERDRQRRAELYARIAEILAEDQPCTWLVWRSQPRGVSRRIAADLFGLRAGPHWSPGLSSIRRPVLD